MIRGSIG